MPVAFLASTQSQQITDSILPVDGVTDTELAEAAQLSSLADETPGDLWAEDGTGRGAVLCFTLPTQAITV